MSQNKKGVLRRLYENLWGTPPKDHNTVKLAKVPVLGVVEQNYGIYQIPSFREMVNVFWNDPLINEAITMFAEQVVSTGAFLTSNPKYDMKINGRTALDVITDWYNANKIDTKLIEIAMELKAFGNSFWRLEEGLGFIKIPIEAIWHAVRVEPEVPLQEKYNIQLMPIYGGRVIPWGQFVHFRRNITGYHAPFGMGVLYALLAKPVDSNGNVAPSVYDIRLSMRSSLNEGFRKFSFGNELWVFEGMSNEDFNAQLEDGKTISDHVADMSSTGNRITTNAKGRIELGVPERTQSYDAFIKNMRDEFFMSLADPSLKLGLEAGFTKATSVTASEVYKYKIATQRKIIKEALEDLFIEILGKLGFDGKKADIRLNFGPEEIAVYTLSDVWAAVDRNIIDRDEARNILEKYHKWEITGPAPTKSVQPKDIMEQSKGLPPPAKGSTQTREVIKKAQESDGNTIPIIISPLKDAIARYDHDLTKIYIDPIVDPRYHKIVRLEEIFIYHLIFDLHQSLKEAEMIAKEYAHALCERLHIDSELYDKDMSRYLGVIISRQGVENPTDVVPYSREEYIWRDK